MCSKSGVVLPPIVLLLATGKGLIVLIENLGGRVVHQNLHVVTQLNAYQHADSHASLWQPESVAAPALEMDARHERHRVIPGDIFTSSSGSFCSGAIVLQSLSRSVFVFIYIKCVIRIGQVLSVMRRPLVFFLRSLSLSLSLSRCVAHRRAHSPSTEATTHTMSTTNQALLPTAHQLKDTGQSTKSVLVNHGSRWLKSRAIVTLALILVVYHSLSSSHSPWRAQPKKVTLVQPSTLPRSSSSLDRQSQIRASFLRTYRIHAKPLNADATPLSLISKNPHNETDGANIVDSLTALHIMNLREEFEAALHHIINMDFQLFDRSPEMIIRSLGALLSTYEITGSNHSKILFKAQELGQQIQDSWSFDQSNVPYPWLSIGQQTGNKTLTIAQAGALALEFNRLSHWTGNNDYRAHADNTSRHIMNNPPAFPGRHSPTLTSSNGPPVAQIVNWGAKLNSFLEYGVKYWHLVGEPAMFYMTHWQESVDVLIQDLLQWSPGNNHPYLAGYSQARGGLETDMSQLSCFAPSSWMLGGKLLKNEAIFMLGLGMAETCYESGHASQIDAGSDKQINQLVNAPFYLRREVVETIWYAWRLTGDPKWQDRAWSLFQASETHFKTTGGYSSSAQQNSSEKFLFGEFFKYLYLTFAEFDYSLDEWVFSTHAHPFRIDPDTLEKRKQKVGHF
ncbi:hypothetical protein PCANC_23523 [Puccinia coronata f. sp. avenae]|uniref:alpha-1,2-Mannosidase n=1 Tax=Puccinia coronata f. sp. avenae TaxID=200324 RepID=A0A2N5S2P7_9BASI|nr:hypothetical protein PCANC_23523 [Puccinia coronata f. sp. avenae]